MKKIATIAASAALLALGVLPALATGNSCENGTTGPFSTNNCTINNTSNIRVKNYNDAVIINKVESESNTGGNNADYNTLGGTIITGNATNNTTVSSVANIVTNNITGGPAMSYNLGTNNVTGPFSINDIDLNNRLDVYLNNQNTAYVKNKVDADANTGENSASYNTGPGSILTGDAGLHLLVGTHANDVLNNVEAGAGGAGGNVAWNGTTGPFSTNNVSIDNDARVRVKNYQDMVVKNYVDAEANTGENDANKNTLGGDILTGGAWAGVGVNTEGNIVTNLISMGFGGFGNQGGNSVTGPGGEIVPGVDPGTNLVEINNSQDISIYNKNNKCRSHNADTLGELLNYHRGYNTSEDGEEKCEPEDLGVRNYIEAESNTGENSASLGTGPGSILAGFAELINSTLVHLNDVLTNIE